MTKMTLRLSGLWYLSHTRWQHWPVTLGILWHSWAPVTMILFQCDNIVTRLCSQCDNDDAWSLLLAVKTATDWSWQWQTHTTLPLLLATDGNHSTRAWLRPSLPDTINLLTTITTLWNANSQHLYTYYSMLSFHWGFESLSTSEDGL